MVKSAFKLLLSITAFAWAVYPAEVGESDEDIQEFLIHNDSDSSLENELNDISYSFNIYVALN